MNIGRIKEKSKVRRRENHNETKRSKVKEACQRRGIRSASVHIKESVSRMIYPREDSKKKKY